MSRRSIAALTTLAAATLVAGCVSQQPAQYQAASSSVAAAPGGTLHSRLNQARRSKGLGQLQADAALARAAANHARDMAQRRFFSHYAPDGGTPVDRVRQAGGCRSAVAENIAENWNSDLKVFEAWMGSPGHYKNIVNGNYTRYGMGEYDGYYVMVLAGPCV